MNSQQCFAQRVSNIYFILQFAYWLMPITFISYLNTKQLELDLVFELMIFSNDCLCVMLWICCHKFITFNRFSMCAHLMVTTFDVFVTSNIDKPLQNMIFFPPHFHDMLAVLATSSFYILHSCFAWTITLFVTLSIMQIL